MKLFYYFQVFQFNHATLQFLFAKRKDVRGTMATISKKLTTKVKNSEVGVKVVISLRELSQGLKAKVRL